MHRSRFIINLFAFAGCRIAFQSKAHHHHKPLTSAPPAPPPNFHRPINWKRATQYIWCYSLNHLPLLAIISTRQIEVWYGMVAFERKILILIPSSSRRLMMISLAPLLARIESVSQIRAHLMWRRLLRSLDHQPSSRTHSIPNMRTGTLWSSWSMMNRPRGFDQFNEVPRSLVSDNWSEMRGGWLSWSDWGVLYFHMRFLSHGPPKRVGWNWIAHKLSLTTV